MYICNSNHTMYQNYNRYSYVLNNPLKYTDPSGWKYEIYKDNKVDDPPINFDNFHSNYGGGGGGSSDFFSFGNSSSSGNLGLSTSIWNMIYAAWNAVSNSGYNYGTFSYENGNVTYSSYGNVYYSSNKGTWGYWSNTNTISGIQTSNNYNSIPITVASTWNSIRNEINTNNTSINNSNIGEGESIDKYFTGLGAGGFITDMKNTIIGYAEKTTKIVSAESKYLSYSKGLGVGVSAITTGYSGYKAYNQYQQSGIKEIFSHRDVLDASIGSIGLGTLGLAYLGLVSNPAGWTIGTGVLIYGGVTLIYDLKKSKP
ncbi:MAG TPA: hypothetical protein PLC61_09470 [Chitinophagales bacterium]|nr:hypothetical protein [Chitinophagales bacterium]